MVFTTMFQRLSLAQIVRIVISPMPENIRPDWHDKMPDCYTDTFELHS